jgi:hypothetical protein
MQQQHVDLANQHAPVSDFLSLSNDSWPITDVARAAYSLTPQQLDRYEQDGFLDNWTVLNELQCNRLREELSAIMDPTHPSHALWHEYNANEAGESSGKSLFHSLGAWRIRCEWNSSLDNLHTFIHSIQS